MADFDVTAAMEGLSALVATIPALEHVQIGAPESPPTRIEAWITVGDPDEITDSVTGIVALRINLIVWFGYVVESAEAAAEAQLGDFISDLVRRLIQNRMNTVDGVTPKLNGSVDRMGLPQAAAGISEYTLMAGQETRTYPLGIRIEQRENIGI